MRFNFNSGPAKCCATSNKEETYAKICECSLWIGFDFKKLKQDTTKNNANCCFSDVCVMVIDTKGKGRMLHCLLDTGCLKSFVLKKITDKNQRSKLSEEDTVHYTTYGETKIAYIGTLSF